MNRREFIGGAGAFALTGCVADGKESCRPECGFVWANLVHFGRNMWGDVVSNKPRNRKGMTVAHLTDAEFEAMGAEEYRTHDHVRFNEPMWKELSSKLKADGCNMIVIDIGEFLRYPSHPELAVRGSWSADRLQTEVRRLRRMGLEVVPKLNFSTCHHAWLGIYARMVSTPKYYEVCSELIRDTMDVFDKPRLFHLGFDEEHMPEYQPNSSLLVIRQGDLWWHDLYWFADEVQKYGSRPWIWSDFLRKNKLSEFVRRMPRTVVQSPWAYDIAKPSINCHKIRIFKQLADNGYDTIPCGSNCCGLSENFPAISEWCARNLDPEHFKGMLMAPWYMMVPPMRRMQWEASDQIAEACRRVRAVNDFKSMTH